MTTSQDKSEHSLLLTRRRKHVCPSKAIVVILLWNTVVELTYNSIVNPQLLMKVRVSGFSFLSLLTVISPFLTVAFIVALCFPLSGLVGDIKCGHYKIVKRSLFLLVLMPFLFALSGCILLIPSTVDDENTRKIALACLLSTFLLAVVVALFGFVMYFANVIPFAMDQLRDLPSQDSHHFFTWFMWTYYVSIFLAKLLWSVMFDIGKLFDSSYSVNSKLTLPGYTLLIVMSVPVSALLLLSLCVAQRRKTWFNVEHGSLSPYLLVYRVSKFAYKHTVPVCRSAFTYCEDFKPSRLDLGKGKYGGPYTNEQVEDVKVFYQLLRILLCFGPIFFMNFAADSLFILYSNSLNMVKESDTQQKLSALQFVNLVLFQNGLLSPLLILIFLPLSFFWCKHFTFGILRRMEMGMLVTLINLAFLLAVEITAHAKNDQLDCMFDYSSDTSPVAIFTPLQTTLLFLTQQILSALSHTMTKVSYLELICAQSPHSMKGMLIGLSYATKGLFEFLAAASVIPFAHWKITYPSCGFGYFSVNVALGLVAFLVFVHATKRYRYRERDEISREREYAEDYYSKSPQEMHNAYA